MKSNKRKEFIWNHLFLFLFLFFVFLSKKKREKISVVLSKATLLYKKIHEIPKKNYHTRNEKNEKTQIEHGRRKIST